MDTKAYTLTTGITTDLSEAIRSYAAECRDAARERGWEGEDDDFEYTPADMEYITGQGQVGRLPTREEWAAAGFGWVGNAHCAPTPLDTSRLQPLPIIGEWVVDELWPM